MAAINDYASLKQAIADQLNLTGTDLSSQAERFISLATARIARDLSVSASTNGQFQEPVTPLTSAGSTNWVLRDYPDLYFYGALIDAAPYLHEDERLPVWTQLYASALRAARWQMCKQMEGRMHSPYAVL